MKKPTRYGVWAQKEFNVIHVEDGRMFQNVSELVREFWTRTGAESHRRDLARIAQERGDDITFIVQGLDEKHYINVGRRVK